MNANNILLGQTRQHEKNAYSFTKDEKYIVLLPWKESKVMCDPLKAEAIVPHTILLQAMREPPVELALMVLQGCEIEESIPNDMQPCWSFMMFSQTVYHPWYLHWGRLSMSWISHQDQCSPTNQPVRYNQQSMKSYRNKLGIWWPDDWFVKVAVHVL